MERRAAGHRAHREHLHPRPLVTQVHPRFIPVHLRFLAPGVALRNKRLASQQAHLPLAGPHVVAHRRLSDRRIRKRLTDPMINPPRRMSLLARCPAVLLQNLIDKGPNRIQLRLGPGRITMRGWQGTSNRPAHHPPVHTKLRRYPGDRADTKLILASKLLE